MYKLSCLHNTVYWNFLSPPFKCTLGGGKDEADVGQLVPHAPRETNQTLSPRMEYMGNLARQAALELEYKTCTQVSAYFIPLFDV